MTETELDPLRRPEDRSQESLRQMSWYTPKTRRRTVYEDVTCDTQPSVARYADRGWCLHFEDGRSLWWEDSTALRSVDWYAFRDPGQLWERPYFQDGSGWEKGIEQSGSQAVNDRLFDDFTPAWTDWLRTNLQVPAFIDNGLWLATATQHRSALSDTTAHCIGLQSAMKQRSAQAFVVYGMDLDDRFGDFPIERSKEAFLKDPAWQPTRDYVERLRTLTDWAEVAFAINAAFDPLVSLLLRRELLQRCASAQGDQVTPAVLRPAQQEWQWARDWTVALLQHVLADERSAEANAEVVAGWCATWLPLARAAVDALEPVFVASGSSDTFAQARASVEQDLAAMHAEAGITATSGVSA
jgi:propane 2-monooxygenase small subunit